MTCAVRASWRSQIGVQRAITTKAVLRSAPGRTADFVLTFARESASVVGCDVNVAAAEATVEMVRAQGGTMISLQPCHLTEPSECQALVDPAVREYGRIDVLFNNAAMAYFNRPEDITNEEWNRDLRGVIDLVVFSPARRGRISRPATCATHE